MSGPWEKFQSADAPPAEKKSAPWERFASSQGESSDEPGTADIYGGDAGRVASSFASSNGIKQLLERAGYKNFKQNEHGEMTAQGPDGKWYKDASNFFKKDSWMPEHPINWAEAHAGKSLPLMGMMGGETLGAAAGVPTTGGTMSLPMAMAAGASGAGIGEGARQAIGRYAGVYDGDAAESAADMSKEMAFGAAGPVLGAGAKILGEGAAYYGKPVVEKAGELAAPLLERAEPLVDAVKGIPESIRKMADRRAFKALGPYKRDVPFEPGEMESIGRTVRDEGVLDGFFPKSYEGISEAAQAAQKGPGARIGATIENAAQEAERAAGPQGAAGVSRAKIADSLRKNLISKTDFGRLSGHNESVEALIQSFEKGEGDLIPIREAQALKEDLAKNVPWKKDFADMSPQEKFMAALHGNVKTGLEDAVEGVEKTINGGDASQYVADKATYGNLKDAADIAGGRARGEFANRMVSASDHGVGGMMLGAALHAGTNPVMATTQALGAAMANKGMRQFGNQLMAKGLGGAANLAEGAINPMIAGSKLLQSIQSNPSLMSGITNAGLRDQLKRLLDDAGSGEALAGQEFGHKADEMPEGQAKSQFLQNN